ncbi:hypothetical protein ACFV2V_13720 [Streptomyces sp. NPDC059698]|uniref:hypothetical protein n=1 Tax=unclassified Streptomyces TaxID=2593676 RepID=UPI00093A4AD4|nr:hypothetical protein [Streptomyces sp. CB02366]OKJ38247.1 hypothetical protein AMK24_11380 [Streptomyces sp. CB02366]
MTEKQTTGPSGDLAVPGRPAHATHGDAAYWARVRRIVDAAPPLSDEQRATIRAALAPAVTALCQQATPKEKAA